jgi:hypothetical protein
MQPLVSKSEAWLADGGLLALLGGLLLRLLIGLALSRSIWLLDTQLIGCSVLVLGLNLAALYLPHSLSGIPQALGALGWACGLSLLPQYFLWHTGPRAHWLVLASLILALVSFGLRWWMARKWSAEIYGKGWAWIDNWAQPRSLRARLLARKALVALGYRRSRESVGE